MKKVKAVGYVSVKKENIHSLKHKSVLIGFKKVCKENNWQLVKIYEEKRSSPMEPKTEMIKMLQEVSLNQDSDIDILISYANGEYIVTQRPTKIKLR
ncbi:recombinase family protein [Heyndrickxia ginsengihumi]|uniref:recombinase family protein n=1 Tax=Heyndrickxia ginsengihumi TaxID=363870 RepID=UPI00203BE280|nr:recombinase family protein [Heyndrickxia ginsengihumi]MCM3022328.1 recombinase family protein [Heyndrickxia ginsengihumi]